MSAAECNQTSFEFSRSDKRKVQADFDGGAVSSNGGLILLSEVERQLKLSQRVAAALPDTRHPDKIQHSQQSMILQRIMGLCAAHEDLNDHDELRHDILMQTLAGKSSSLASAPTLCRMEARSKKRPMFALQKLLIDLFIEKHADQPPKELVLDFDATDDPTHGNQEGRFFHGYYKSYCFLPLYVFCGSDPLLALLRPSNTDGAKGALLALKYMVKRFREAWGEGVAITFRGDTGFMRKKVLRWCEKSGVDYIVGQAHHEGLKKVSEAFRQKVKEDFEKTEKEQRQFTECGYRTQEGSKFRRVIVKVEYSQRGENTRCIVTTLKGDPQELYDTVYCARGDMENRIKEQQLGLFADRTSTTGWWSNQLRLLMSTFAYILLDRLRTQALKGTDWVKKQCTTLQVNLIKIGAVITRNTRRICIHLSTSYPHQNIFKHAWRNLMSG
jgi:hypothetical protein